MSQPIYHIATGQLKLGKTVLANCMLHCLGAATWSLYDGTDATGELKLQFFNAGSLFNTEPRVYNFKDGIEFKTGIFIAISGTVPLSTFGVR